MAKLYLLGGIPHDTTLKEVKDYISRDLGLKDIENVWFDPKNYRRVIFQSRSIVVKDQLDDLAAANPLKDKILYTDAEKETSLLWVQVPRMRCPYLVDKLPWLFHQRKNGGSKVKAIEEKEDNCFVLTFQDGWDAVSSVVESCWLIENTEVMTIPFFDSFQENYKKQKERLKKQNLKSQLKNSVPLPDLKANNSKPAINQLPNQFVEKDVQETQDNYQANQEIMNEQLKNEQHTRLMSKVEINTEHFNQVKNEKENRDLKSEIHLSQAEELNNKDCKKAANENLKNKTERRVPAVYDKKSTNELAEDLYKLDCREKNAKSNVELMPKDKKETFSNSLLLDPACCALFFALSLELALSDIDITYDLDEGSITVSGQKKLVMMFIKAVIENFNLLQENWRNEFNLFFCHSSMYGTKKFFVHNSFSLGVEKDESGLLLFVHNEQKKMNVVEFVLKEISLIPSTILQSLSENRKSELMHKANIFNATDSRCKLMSLENNTWFIAKLGQGDVSSDLTKIEDFVNSIPETALERKVVPQTIDTDICATEKCGKAEQCKKGKKIKRVDFQDECIEVINSQENLKAGKFKKGTDESMKLSKKVSKITKNIMFSCQHLLYLFDVMGMKQHVLESYDLQVTIDRDQEEITITGDDLNVNMVEEALISLYTFLVEEDKVDQRCEEVINWTQCQHYVTDLFQLYSECDAANITFIVEDCYEMKKTFKHFLKDILGQWREFDIPADFVKREELKAFIQQFNDKNFAFELQDCGRQLKLYLISFSNDNVDEVAQQVEKFLLGHTTEAHDQTLKLPTIDRLDVSGKCEFDINGDQSEILTEYRSTTEEAKNKQQNTENTSYKSRSSTNHKNQVLFSNKSKSEPNNYSSGEEELFHDAREYPILPEAGKPLEFDLSSMQVEYFRNQNVAQRIKTTLKTFFSDLKIEGNKLLVFPVQSDQAHAFDKVKEILSTIKVDTIKMNFPGLFDCKKSSQVFSSFEVKYKCVISKEQTEDTNKSSNDKEKSETIFKATLLQSVTKGPIKFHLIQGDSRHLNVKTSLHICPMSHESRHYSNTMTMYLPDWFVDGESFEQREMKEKSFVKELTNVFKEVQGTYVDAIRVSISSRFSNPFPAHILAKAIISSASSVFGSKLGEMAVFLCETKCSSLLKAFQYQLKQTTAINAIKEDDLTCVRHVLTKKVVCPKYNKIQVKVLTNLTDCTEWRKKKVLVCHPMQSPIELESCPLKHEFQNPWQYTQAFKYLEMNCPDGLAVGDVFQLDNSPKQSYDVAVYGCQMWGINVHKVLDLVLGNCLKKANEGGFDILYIVLPGSRFPWIYPTGFLLSRCFDYLDNLDKNNGTCHLNLLVPDKKTSELFINCLKQRSPSVWTPSSWASSLWDKRPKISRTPQNFDSSLKVIHNENDKLKDFEKELKKELRKIMVSHMVNLGENQHTRFLEAREHLDKVHCTYKQQRKKYCWTIESLSGYAVDEAVKVAKNGYISSVDASDSGLNKSDQKSSSVLKSNKIGPVKSEMESMEIDKSADNKRMHDGFSSFPNAASSSIQWQWFYFGVNDRVKFDYHDNKYLEHAYTVGKESLEVQGMSVDLKKLSASSLNDHMKQYGIEREEVLPDEDFPKPMSWIGDQLTAKLKPLNVTFKEMESTLSSYSSGEDYCKIIKIHQIQNYCLYNRFRTKQNIIQGDVEKVAWQRIASENVDSVIERGCHKSLLNEFGDDSIGDGISFALDWRTCIKQKDFEDEEKVFLLQCTLCTSSKVQGDGKYGLRYSPSCVSNKQFIMTFSTSQVYPTHVVEMICVKG